MSGFNIGELEGGGKSWSPEAIGDKISGTIIKIERKQQTDFQTRAPITWDDGSPRMQTVVTLQTELKDDADDDGVRALWLKGGKSFEAAEGQGHSGEIALVEAAKKAGVKSIEEGSHLTAILSGKAKPTTRGFQPAKLYAMKLEAAPASSVSVDDLFDD